jgi:hypothetical protein
VAAAPECGEPLKSLEGVANVELTGAFRGVQRTLYDGAGGTSGDRLGYVIVAVRTLTAESDEEVALRRLAGIDGGAPERGVTGATAAHEQSVHPVQDVSH